MILWWLSSLPPHAELPLFIYSFLRIMLCDLGRIISSRFSPSWVGEGDSISLEVWYSHTGRVIPVNRCMLWSALWWCVVFSYHPVMKVYNSDGWVNPPLQPFIANMCNLHMPTSNSMGMAWLGTDSQAVVSYSMVPMVILIGFCLPRTSQWLSQGWGDAETWLNEKPHETISNFCHCDFSCTHMDGCHGEN